MASDWQNAGFALYLHWPFCQAKCPYCDFNSFVSDNIDQNAWLTAFQNEIRRYRTLTGARTLNTVYFGGGTPSLMDVSVVGGILDTVRECWNLANNVEITLEANPTSVEADKLVGFKYAGVNRVSLGVQALNDADLKKLGRMHSVEEALKAIDAARTTFDRVNMDLIYSRQDQSPESWQDELNRAIDFDLSHMSLYQLTVEPNTAFGVRHRAGKLLGLPMDDISADMFDWTASRMTQAGFDHYEISNFAKPDHQSAHNGIYWKSGDYIGIGPGAHGRISIKNSRLETIADPSPQLWLMKALDCNTGVETTNALSPGDHGDEFIIMGLRHIDGVDLTRYTSITGKSLNIQDYLLDDGFLEASGKTIRATPKGRPLLNKITEVLLT